MVVSVFKNMRKNYDFMKDVTVLSTTYVNPETGERYPNHYVKGVLDYMESHGCKPGRDFEFGEMEISFFNDGTSKAKSLNNVRNTRTFLVHHYLGEDGNRNFITGKMALMHAGDSIKKSGVAKELTAVLPFYPGERQDYIDEARADQGAKLWADMLSIRFDKAIRMEMHSKQTQGFHSIPVDNIPGMPLFVRAFKKKYGTNPKNSSVAVISRQEKQMPENSRVAAIDIGSAKNLKEFSKLMGSGEEYLPQIVVFKYRQQAGENEVVSVVGDPNGMDIYIIDDMIDTSGSLSKGAGRLYEMGARRIIAGATHPIFSRKKNEHKEAYEIIDEAVDRGTPLRIITGDTLPISNEVRGKDWFDSVVPTGPLMGRSIIEHSKPRGSMSKLYKTETLDELGV